jgi:ABC-2 type transport system permease protein
MTATLTSPTAVERASVWSDFSSMALRALRNLKRDPEAVGPPLIIGVFFYAVNLGALSKVVEGGLSLDFKAFQLPTAVLFGITGLSRAMTVVTDIQNGYLDRLLATPLRRWTILAGQLVADFVLALGLTLPIMVCGLVIGVDFKSGPLGFVLFAVIAACWSMAFAGFSYAIAFATGNPAAVGNAFLLFFPFAFLTTGSVPLEQLSGWMQAVAKVNPMTYLLEGLRALITEGWAGGSILQGIAAPLGVGIISFFLATGAMRRRVSSK